MKKNKKKGVWRVPVVWFGISFGTFTSACRFYHFNAFVFKPTKILIPDVGHDLGLLLAKLATRKVNQVLVLCGIPTRLVILFEGTR